jgi:ferredoxin
MLYIHPVECIDCGACVPACPVAAIYDAPETTPATQKTLIEANAVFRAGEPDTVTRAEEIVKAHVDSHPDLMAIPPAERAAAHGKIAPAASILLPKTACQFFSRPSDSDNSGSGVVLPGRCHG